MAEIKDTYLSIAAQSEGLFKDQGSRFIALAYPVETEQQVKDIVSALRKQYHDARHHCYAYRLGHMGRTFRSSDDGEPSGSAGRPILGQIDSAGLSDVLVVVVRYFGGIKLGIPGLIRAYKASTADALTSAVKINKTAVRHFTLHFGYLAMNDVMKMVKDMDLGIAGQDFGMDCTMTVSVRLGLVDDFISRSGDIEGCTVTE